MNHKASSPFGKVRKWLTSLLESAVEKGKILSARRKPPLLDPQKQLYLGVLNSLRNEKFCDLLCNAFFSLVKQKSQEDIAYLLKYLCPCGCRLSFAVWLGCPSLVRYVLINSKSLQQPIKLFACSPGARKYFAPEKYTEKHYSAVGYDGVLDFDSQHSLQIVKHSNCSRTGLFIFDSHETGTEECSSMPWRTLTFPNLRRRMYLKMLAVAKEQALAAERGEPITETNEEQSDSDDEDIEFIAHIYGALEYFAHNYDNNWSSDEEIADKIKGEDSDDSYEDAEVEQVVKFPLHFREKNYVLLLNSSSCEASNLAENEKEKKDCYTKGKNIESDNYDDLYFVIGRRRESITLQTKLQIIDILEEQGWISRYLFYDAEFAKAVYLHFQSKEEKGKKEAFQSNNESSIKMNSSPKCADDLVFDFEFLREKASCENRRRFADCKLRNILYTKKKDNIFKGLLDVSNNSLCGQQFAVWFTWMRLRLFLLFLLEHGMTVDIMAAIMRPYISLFFFCDHEESGRQRFGDYVYLANVLNT